MQQIEALKISEKINVYGKARAEALYNHDPARDDWSVVATLGHEFEWTDDKVREIAEEQAPSAAMIEVRREPGLGVEYLIITSVPKRISG